MARRRPPAGHADRASACCTRSTTSGPAPEPNLTVLWSKRLPDGLQALLPPRSRSTPARSSIENDDLMRRQLGRRLRASPAASRRCALGKQMQFFGARANLAKCLLYAINGGRDEITRQAGRPGRSSRSQGDVPRLRRRGGEVRRHDGLAGADVYVHAMNCIHYMHDKYTYERLEMALHDYDVAAHDGLRHRRPVGRRRQPLGDHATPR